MKQHSAISHADRSKQELVEACLQKIADPCGQGKSTFTSVYATAARLAAQHADRLAELHVEQHPLAGIPVSIKDLFDVQGETTLAGSVALKDAPPATADAAVVKRLRRAGAAIIGKTNMTEFAFSGLGLNPHYGTPLNAWDRKSARIPGGSSSGAAISIVDGMALAAIGTDTGGSCRIPAALNGIVGMKPTAASVPADGAVPLSRSYDSIGPLAPTVGLCAEVYAAISGAPRRFVPLPEQGLRFGVVQNYVLEHMDGTVSKAYENTLRRIAKSGATLLEIKLPVLDELASLFAGGGLVAAEAYQWHRRLLDSHGDSYDPRVATRIVRGADISAADYITILQRRRALIGQWEKESAGFDALLMPTVPLVAPKLSELHDDDEYGRVNLLMLRNPTLVNALDGCAVSIPCHEAGEAPVGLSIVQPHGNDWRVLAIARQLEKLLAPR